MLEKRLKELREQKELFQAESQKKLGKYIELLKIKNKMDESNE